MDTVFEQISPLETLITRLVEFLPNLVVAIIILLLTLLLARIAFNFVQRSLQNRKRVDPETVLLLSRMAQISVIVLGTIWALSAVDFDVTGFVAGLGIVGFTVGFALKDVAENFVAGILLLVQQPFDIGDAVEAGGFSGKVTDIQIRTTTIRTWDGLLVLVPNAKVYGNPITNFSRVPQRRISLNVGVDYGSDLEKVDRILVEVANALPGIKDDPAPFVVFNEFAESAIKATLYFWIDMSEADYLKSIDAIVKGVKLAFERENINIPFPTRRVYNEQIVD